MFSCHYSCSHILQHLNIPKVGLDISGDPRRGSLTAVLSYLSELRNTADKDSIVAHLTIHTAEVHNTLFIFSLSSFILFSLRLIHFVLGSRKWGGDWSNFRSRTWTIGTYLLLSRTICFVSPLLILFNIQTPDQQNRLIRDPKLSHTAIELCPTSNLNTLRIEWATILSAQCCPTSSA